MGVKNDRRVLVLGIRKTETGAVCTDAGTDGCSRRDKEPSTINMCSAGHGEPAPRDLPLPKPTGCNHQEKTTPGDQETWQPCLHFQRVDDLMVQVHFCMS